MKKTKTMRIAVLMLALTLLTCCFVGSTFAKYTSKATGSATATVAKWDITANDTQMAVAGPTSFTFDILTTVADDSATLTSDLVDDANVTNTLLAPGTAGKFALTVANKSEVAAEYDIAFAVSYDNLPDGVTLIPVQFSDDGTTWKDDISALNITDTQMAIGAADSVVTIYWRWAFTDGHASQTDANDTALGNAARLAASAEARPTLNVTATITVDQVD